MIKYNPASKQIQITRGDTISLVITAKDSEGEEYIFTSGSKIRFVITEKKNESNIIIDKQLTLDKDMEEVRIDLTSEETKIGDLINEPVIYWYEVSVENNGDIQTIIGYDKCGSKEFVVYPEAMEEQNNG